MTSAHVLRITDLASGDTTDYTIIERVRLTKRHTGKATGEVTLPLDTSLNDDIKGLQRVDIYYGDPDSGGTHRFRGFAGKVRHDRRRNETTLEVDGVAKLLEEDSTTTTITSTPTWEALRDYINNNTGFSATAVQPDTSTILTKDELDKADTDAEFSDIYSPASTEPLQIANGKLEVLKSCKYIIPAGSFSGSNLIDGVAYGFFEGEDDFDVGSLSFDYTVPSGDWELLIRRGESTSSQITASVFVNGNSFGNFTSGTLGWVNIGTGSFDITSSVDIDIRDSTTDDVNNEMPIDAVVIRDTRYNHGGLDNTTDSNDQLAAPRNYGPITIASSSISAPSGIEKGYLDVQINNTGNDQRLQLSFDGGSTWVPSGGAENNTTSVSATPSGDTRTVRARVTLDGADTTRTTATPSTGFEAQAIDVHTVSADLDDLSVVDSLTLDGSHMDNIQRLAEYGQLRVIPHHDPNAKEVTVIPYDPDDPDVQKSVDWRRLATPESTIPQTHYANKAVVEGAKDSNGNRPRGVAQDDQAIQQDGREITLGGKLIDTTITTEAGARSRAISLLSKAQLRDQPRGTLEIVAQDIDPGWFYKVMIDGVTNYLPAEDVTLAEGRDEARTTINFDPATGLSDDIADQRRETGGLKDQV